MAERRSLLNEEAVKTRPVILRAVACLGALYQTLKNPALAAKCYRKCKELESSPVMKKYFDDLLKGVSRKEGSGTLHKLAPGPVTASL